MKARSKTQVSKKKTRTTRNRRPRRRQPELNVAPVAVRSGESSVVIPATIKDHGDSNRAVISVEVKRGNSVRKRAALIPVAVKKRPRIVDEREIRRRQHEWATQPFDPITDSVLYGTRVAESLVGLLHTVGAAAIDTAEGLSRAVFARLTARETAVTPAISRTLDAIEFPAFTSSSRTSQLESRAA